MKKYLNIGFVLLVFLISSCSVINSLDVADDDVYYSSKTNSSKPVLIPKANLDEIMRENPSKIDGTKPANKVNDGTSLNPNSSLNYTEYKKQQETNNTESSVDEQKYEVPPFSQSDENDRLNYERRQQRRLARINNSIFYNNDYNYGYSNCYNFYSNFGCNNNFYSNWGNSFGFRLNCFNSWNFGFNYGNILFNPYGGYQYSPFWNYYYNPYYYRTPSIRYSDSKPNNPSRPRQVISTNIPKTNGGSIDNPNANPRFRSVSSDKENLNTTNPISQPEINAPKNSGGVLIPTENGNVKYVAPRNNESNSSQQYYPNNQKSNQNHQQYSEPSNSINKQNYLRSNHSEKNYNQPRQTQPVYKEPSRTENRTNPTPTPRGGNNTGGGNSRPR